MVEQIAAARPRKESLTNSFAMMRSSVSNSGLFRDLTFASSHHPDAESSHSGSGRAGAISSNNSNKANSNNNNSVLSPPVDKPPSMMANTANSRAFSVDRVNASITSPIIALLGSSFMSPNRVSINVNVPDPTVAVNTEPSAAAFGTTKDAATIVSVGNVLKSMESNNATERDRLGSTSVSVSNRNGTSERTVGQTALMITKQ